VVGDEREVNGHQLDHRTQPEHRGADRSADDYLLGDWSVNHALRPELVEQAFGHAICAAERSDVLADEEDGFVALHLFGQRLAQRHAVKLLFGGHHTGSLPHELEASLEFAGTPEYARSSGRLSHCSA